VLVAGDAAHMINSAVRRWDRQRDEGGTPGGCTAAAAIREGDTSERRLARYHQAWMDLLGDDHLKYYGSKQALESVDDEFFNKLAAHREQDPSGETLDRADIRARPDQTSATDSGGGAFSSNRLHYRSPHGAAIG